MPNWCSNGITIKHKDPQMIERVLKGKDGLLAEFIPTPASLLETMSGSFGDSAKQLELERKQLDNIAKYGYKDWYDWQVANWGTKWDFALESVERTDPNTVQASFESAWAPPCAAYEKLCAMGFEIEAFYYEPGMAFVGKWSGNEEDYFDDYYEYGGTNSETVREVIGEELDDYFNISEDMSQWEEENEENES